MGASDFFTRVEGTDAKAAFAKAVEDALYSYGHDGYTGTIAEKSEFTMLGSVQTWVEADDKAQAMIDEDHPKISDKWGPAGCIRVTDTTKPGFLFFGWASC